MGKRLERLWASESGKRLTGRSAYKPRGAVYIGMAGILLSALLGRFWVAVVVLIPVILYAWWRFWTASHSEQGRGD